MSFPPPAASREDTTTARREDTTAARREPAIAVAGLTKVFPGADPAQPAVADLAFTVRPASTTALLGGNGAGKTTTLSMLLGLLLPSAGTIRMLGCDMIRQRYRVLPRINFSSPYVDLPHRLTVRENLTVYGHLYALADVTRRIGELSDALDLGAVLNRPAGKLSAGQKTRVALAKAMLNRPEVLILDEPTASLDPDTADWVRGYLHDFQKTSGATIILASHNMAEVERLADQVVMMKQGRVVARGAPAALLDRYGRDDLEQVFLDIARDRRQPSADIGGKDSP